MTSNLKMRLIFTCSLQEILNVSPQLKKLEQQLVGILHELGRIGKKNVKPVNTLH